MIRKEIRLLLLDFVPKIFSLKGQNRCELDTKQKKSCWMLGSGINPTINPN
jgi:hypothetical protein